MISDNPFFVLGIAADASRIEIEREAQKLLGMLELDFADLEEVYRLRALLETDALLRGVPHATDVDVEALRAAARACRAAGAVRDVLGQLAANRRLHDRLHALAGSAPLARLIDQLWDRTEAYRALYYALPGEAGEADTAHEALVEAVARRDAPAAVAIQDAHRRRALEALRGALRREPT